MGYVDKELLGAQDAFPHPAERPALRVRSPQQRSRSNPNVVSIQVWYDGRWLTEEEVEESLAKGAARAALEREQGILPDHSN